MASKKKAWYAVKKGRRTGLFTAWEECRRQVIGFPGAEFKGFYTREEAEAYLSGKETGTEEPPETEDGMIAYVDGSYAPTMPDCYAFGAVLLYEGETIQRGMRFIDPENALMRNVAGEVAGAKFAMEYCVAHKISALALYYDYAGIEKWCTGEWKANRPGTRALKEYYGGLMGKLSVTFHKVKSHTGVKYNEMADRLAKAALGLEKSET